MSDPKEILAERTARLEADLATLEDKRRDAATQSARAERVEAELADARRVLASLEKDRAGRKRTALPLLDRIAIAAPCSARWSDMKGDDKVRFCGSCEKNVYDLSAMTRDEAEEKLQALESPCVRFWRRTDGRVMTQDCPVGVRRKRMRLAAAIAVGSGLSMAVAGLFAFIGADDDTPEPPAPPAVLVIPTPPPPSAAPSATIPPHVWPTAGAPMLRPETRMGRMQVRPTVTPTSPTQKTTVKKPVPKRTSDTL